MPFDLAGYAGKFPQVCLSKFGRTYDFSALEQRLAALRDAKHILSAKDVSRVFDPGATPFANYWPRPQNKVLEEALGKERLHLAPVAGDGTQLVERLLAIFHNLGTASIILQFVYPDRFAIFSTPIVHLLQVTRPGLLDMYVAYCCELAAWRDHFRLPSVAATATALWTYAEIVKAGDPNPLAAEARRNFEEDIWIQRRRAAQVIGPFLHRYGRLQLARILVDVDAVLAGKIASEEYERLLRVACQRLRRKPLPHDKGAAERLIDDLADHNLIRLEDKPELRRIWDTRNRVVHPDGKRPEPEEVEAMIDHIERICRPWEQAKRFAVAAPQS